MSNAAVILLPGPGAPEGSMRSVRHELGDAARVFVLAVPGFPLVQADGAVPATAPEILAACDHLAFVRSGDRWRPGTFEARARPLVAHPSAALAVAGHALVDASGAVSIVVAAPLPPVDPAQVLLRASLEASATIVRTSALHPDALDLLVRPHGDAVVWSHLVREHGLLPSIQTAADVLVDPDRHGHDPSMRTELLLAALREPVAGEGPGGVTLRRELLRRLYVEPVEDPGLRTVDLSALLAPDGRRSAAPVIEDLQWALERQRDALLAERVRWPYGEIAEDEQVPGDTEEDVQDLRMHAEDLWNEILVRNATRRGWIS